MIREEVPRLRHAAGGDRAGGAGLAGCRRTAGPRPRRRDRIDVASGAGRAARRAARARRREPGDARRRRGPAATRERRARRGRRSLRPAPDRSVRSRRVGARDPSPRRRREARAVRAPCTIASPRAAVRDGRRRGPRRPRRRRHPAHAGYDKPDRADELLAWLRAAGFRAERTWSSPDLAAFVATRAEPLSRCGAARRGSAPSSAGTPARDG